MKRLFIFALIAALPAAALSLKDWEAKTNPDQIQYVSACLARLVLAVGKTDQPLAEKVRRYYSDKPAGQKTSTGLLDLLARIGRIESDRRADLSKIEIEDQILLTTVAKVGALPGTVTRAVVAGLAQPKPDFRDAGPPRQPAAPAPRHEPTPADDPIGAGGFIGPPVYRVADHTAGWIGRSMTVEGTVDKVSSFAEIASIIFREAPDGSFKVFLPDSGPLRARYGRDLGGLIGKTVRVTGNVQKFAATDGGIRIEDLGQMKVVQPPSR